MFTYLYGIAPKNPELLNVGIVIALHDPKAPIGD